MNKIHLGSILFPFAAAMLLAGCQREGLSPSSDVLTAVIEGIGTKTSYDSIEGKFVWSEGDEIAIHYSDGNYASYEVASNGTVNALSSITRDYFAVYPASAAVAADYGNPELKVTLPDAYDITDIVSGATGNPGADFSPTPMVAVNDVNDNVLDFYHVGGLLRITLVDLDPATQTVRVDFDKDVMGTYTVDTTDPVAPVITTTGTATNNVVTFTLAATSVGTLTAPIVLNVPVPCGTYARVRVRALERNGDVIAFQTFDGKALTFGRRHSKKLVF